MQVLENEHPTQAGVSSGWRTQRFSTEAASTVTSRVVELDVGVLKILETLNDLRICSNQKVHLNQMNRADEVFQLA